MHALLTILIVAILAAPWVCAPALYVLEEVQKSWGN